MRTRCNCFLRSPSTMASKMQCKQTKSSSNCSQFAETRHITSLRFLSATQMLLAELVELKCLQIIDNCPATVNRVFPHPTPVTEKIIKLQWKHHALKESSAC